VAASATGAVAEPNAVVARVGAHVITGAMFAHAFAIQIRSEGTSGIGLVPPSFSGCIAHLKTAPAQPVAGAPAPGSSIAVLRAECLKQYLLVETHALDSLILAQWLTAGAAELGTGASEAAIQAEIAKTMHNEGKRFYENLATQGRSVADVAAEIRTQLSAEAIRQTLTARANQLSEAQIASYYEHNRATYGVPEKRTVEIARLSTAASARKLKRELASGKSFAGILKQLPSPQPIFSSNGVVPAYVSGMYHEPALNNAIISAKPGVLSGPVAIELGYYIFKVTHVSPAQQKTLAQSRALIRQQLPNILYVKSLEAFIASWRTRWTARTDCQPGYVVAKCRQYVRPPNALPESPTSLE
jgi:foldase protein PrsA